MQPSTFGIVDSLVQSITSDWVSGPVLLWNGMRLMLLGTRQCCCSTPWPIRWGWNLRGVDLFPLETIHIWSLWQTNLRSVFPSAEWTWSRTKVSRMEGTVRMEAKLVCTWESWKWSKIPQHWWAGWTQHCKQDRVTTCSLEKMLTLMVWGTFLVQSSSLLSSLREVFPYVLGKI